MGAWTLTPRGGAVNPAVRCPPQSVYEVVPFPWSLLIPFVAINPR
jgi:hypothetical protein